MVMYGSTLILEKCNLKDSDTYYINMTAKILTVLAAFEDKMGEEL